MSVTFQSSPASMVDDCPIGLEGQSYPPVRSNVPPPTLLSRDRINYYLIDEDSRSRSSLREFISQQGFSCYEFDELQRFESLVTSEPNGVIIAEFRSSSELGDASLEAPFGVRLIRLLKTRGWECPVLFLTQSPEVSDCSTAYREGAVAYLKKPLLPSELQEHFEKANQLSSLRKQQLQRQREMADKLSLLTSREREILDLLVAGQSMKAIASTSGTSFQAVARHRQRILEKLRLEGDVALVRWFFNLSATCSN